jgi:hypothetical protein
MSKLVCLHHESLHVLDDVEENNVRENADGEEIRLFFSRLELQQKKEFLPGFFL